MEINNLSRPKVPVPPPPLRIKWSSPKTHHDWNDARDKFHCIGATTVYGCFLKVGRPLHQRILLSPSVNVRTMLNKNMTAWENNINYFPKVTSWANIKAQQEELNEFQAQSGLRWIIGALDGSPFSTKGRPLSWIGCLTSQLTIFQSYMWRHIDAQADWRRSLTYSRAPNAIDIS